MALFNSESNLSSSITNCSGCVGLIQFCPDVSGGKTKTIQGKKIDLNWLKSIGMVKQLDYVYMYFYPFKNYIASYDDLYLINFYPNAGGKFAGTLDKGENWVFPFSQKTYLVNKGIDTNEDGKITIADFRKFIYKKIPDSAKKYFENNWFKEKLKISTNYLNRNKFVFISVATVTVITFLSLNILKSKNKGS